MEVTGRFAALIEAVRTNLWLWPVIMIALALGLAQTTILIDRGAWLGPQLRSLLPEFAVDRVEWLYGGGTDGARDVLATIAASMIAIAATVFSITIVALSLASNQFGPRLLRVFMADRGTQLALSTFIATFAYCLVILGVVDGNDARQFVPTLSVSVALVLGLTNVLVLVYFIHHVAISIQAPHVINAVGAELDQAIERTFSDCEESLDDGVDDGDGGTARSEWDIRPDIAVMSGSSGYVQAVDLDGLLECAVANDAFVEVLRRGGDHVLEGSALALVSSAAGTGDDTVQAVRGCFAIGHLRTPLQDVSYLIDQLLQVALRALSSGINDPMTAEACIDRLGESLSKALRADAPDRFRVDDAGIVRLRIPTDDFGSLLGAAFDPIRANGLGQLRIATRLLMTLADLNALAIRADHVEAIHMQADRIWRDAQRIFRDEQDLQTLRRYLHTA